MRKFLFLFFAAWVAMSASGLYADVPNEINYQGRLREYGQPVTANRTMNFKIYAVESGGVPVWSSGDVVVAVTTGTFSYALSPSGVDWRWRDFWIETNVSGKILSPREKISAGIYALHSRAAEDISKTSGTVTVTIGGSQVLSVSTWTIDAANLTVSVATPTSASHATTKNYVESWLPTGTILMWGGSQASIPSGWLLCDGAAISRTTYARLFAAIGTVHGVGDGSTTFGIPDLRNRFIVGAGNTYSVKDTGGANTVTLAVTEIPSHTHTQDAHNHTQNAHTHTQNAHGHSYSDYANYTSEPWGGSTQWRWTTEPTPTARTTGDTTATNQSTTATNQSTTATNQNTGGGAAHENRPPFYALCYIIKN